MNEDRQAEWAATELLEIASIFSPSGGEHAVVDHLAARCRAWELPVRRLEVPGGAADDLVIGWSERPRLLLTAHVDTITPTWSWEASRRDGTVRGLGVGDCKGSVIAFLLGMLLARERGVPVETMPVGVGLCVDEELGGTGSIAMARAIPAEFVIAGEPSGLSIGVAEAGFVDARYVVHGRASHGSFPELGDNAIEKAARLALAVHEEPFARAEHPLMGRNVPGTLWFEGGGSLHVIPDRASLRIEIRVVPGGPSASEIEARMRELARAHDAEMELVEPSVEPFEADPAGPLTTALRSAIQAVTGTTTDAIGVPAWTDAHNFVDLAGAQAVVWGPGDFSLAHDPEESIDVDEVVRAARVVDELLAGAGTWL